MMSRLNDEATDRMLAEAAGGATRAVGDLLQRERSRLRRTVEIRLDERIRTRVDPSDILQESFAEAVRRLPEYLERRAVPFYVWLRKIVEDRLVDAHRRHLKSLGRSVTREVNPAQSRLSLDLLASTSMGAVSRISREEARQVVRRALLELSEADQKLLLMRHVEQLRVREIAFILNIGEGAAKSRLRRSLERLKSILDHSMDAGGQPGNE